MSNTKGSVSSRRIEGSNALAYKTQVRSPSRVLRSLHSEAGTMLRLWLDSLL